MSHVTSNLAAAGILLASFYSFAAGVGSPYLDAANVPLVLSSGQTNEFNFTLQNCCEPSLYAVARMVQDDTFTNFATLLNESINPNTNYFLPPGTINVQVPVRVVVPPRAPAGVYRLRCEFFFTPVEGMFGSAIGQTFSVVNRAATITTWENTPNEYRFYVDGLTNNRWVPPPAYVVQESTDLTKSNAWHDVHTNTASFWYTSSIPSTVTNYLTNALVVAADGFEDGHTESNVLYTSGEVISGWTVDVGSVKTLGNSSTNPPILTAPHTGSRFLDCNAEGPGVISTNFPSAPGLDYEVRFFYATNSASSNAISATVRVLDQNMANEIATINLRPPGSSPGTWIPASFVFRATSMTSIIQIVSSSPGPNGVLFDSFTVDQLDIHAQQRTLSQNFYRILLP